jgi:hypothetical protein
MPPITFLLNVLLRLFEYLFFNQPIKQRFNRLPYRRPVFDHNSSAALLKLFDWFTHTFYCFYGGKHYAVPFFEKGSKQVLIHLIFYRPQTFYFPYHTNDPEKHSNHFPRQHHSRFRLTAAIKAFLIK